MFLEKIAPRIQRKIQCPGQWMITPSVDVYLYEEVPWLKECSDTVDYQGKPFKIKKKRIKKDFFGRKMIDWKKLYELRKTGLVIQPWVTASWAIEHCYDPLSQCCIHCDKRCKRGLGTINEFTLGRIHPER